MRKKRLGLVLLILTAGLLCWVVRKSSILSPSLVLAQTFDCSSVTEIPQAECEALVAFYNSTGGASWKRKDNWLVTTTPCSWYGLLCGSGHVTWIEMLYNDLSGTLPPQLGNLSELKILNLPYNSLTGSLPAELGNLTKLDSLSFHTNKLTGPIPAQLGNLTVLRNLYLNTNSMTGPIPPELGNLDNLLKLVLKSNRLTGLIPPELGNMDKLQVLYLSCNQLSGEIPLAITNLETLLDGSGIDVDYNLLTASDPAVIAFMQLKDRGPLWDQTQTVPPKDLQVVMSPSSVLTWTPILYQGDGGYYEVGYSQTAGGPYTVLGTTLDKTIGSYPLDVLSPDLFYYLTVRSFTPAHGQIGDYVYQQSDLLSSLSEEAQFPCQKDGDINGDGEVNILDMQTLIRMITHWPRPDPAFYPDDYWCRGDLREPHPGGDGKWDILDLQQIICWILKTC